MAVRPLKSVARMGKAAAANIAFHCILSRPLLTPPQGEVHTVCSPGMYYLFTLLFFCNKHPQRRALLQMLRC